MVRFARQPVIVSRPWSENIEVLHPTPSMALEEMQSAIQKYISPLGIDCILFCEEKKDSRWSLCFGPPKKYSRYTITIQFHHRQFNLGTIRIQEWPNTLVSAIWKDQPIEFQGVGMFHARIKKNDICRGCKKLASFFNTRFIPNELNPTFRLVEIPEK
jgi:hypothetical protein